MKSVRIVRRYAGYKFYFDDRMVDFFADDAAGRNQLIKTLDRLAELYPGTPIIWEVKE